MDKYLEHAYDALEEWRIKTSVDQFVADATKTKNMCTANTLKYIDDFGDHKDDVYKIVCEINDKNQYRLVQLRDGICIEQQVWTDIPEGTTHLYYDEFISHFCDGSTIYNQKCTPIIINGNDMEYFSQHSRTWNKKDIGLHIIESTKYHPIEWCKEDLKNPRMRKMSLSYQLSDSFDLCDFYNDLDDRLDELNISQNSIKKDIIDLFIQNFRKNIKLINGNLKTIDDVYNLIESLKVIDYETIETGDEYDLLQDFIYFINCHDQLLKKVFVILKNKHYKFEV